MGVAFNADGSATFTTLDTDGDGILGYPMDNGPFVGFTAAFSGTATVVAAEVDDAAAVVEAVVVMDDQLIQLRSGEIVTQAEASIAEYGLDYTDGATDTLVKYEVWIDASALSALNASATEIRGYQFDMDVNGSEVEAWDFSMISGDNFGFNAANTANSGITFNSDTGDVVMASSGTIVDNIATNDGPPYFLGTEKLIGTFYVNPIDASGETAIDITIDNMLVVTDAGNIVQDDYTYDVLEIV
jgi:hypothetical protein